MTRRFLLVILLSILVFFSNIGGFSIYILDEAKNSSCAFEMMHRDDPIVPTFNGILRTDKPPLHYYFMMGSYTIFGINAWGARFFSAIMGILAVVTVFSTVRNILNENVAFYCAIVMLSSLQFAIQFHLAVPDPYLITFMTASILALYLGYHENPKWYRLGYFLMGLGFMSKGLIAIVFPGIIFFAYLLIQESFNWKTIRSLKVLQGILIFAVTALPWYILVGLETNGAWLRGFFIEHNLDRYTSTMEGHRMFPLAPFVLILAATLPFSVFIIQAGKLTWRTRSSEPFLIYCAISLLTILMFFSLSRTLLPGYVSPAIPFIAIILGYYLDFLERNIASITTSTRWIISVINVMIGVAICVLITVALDKEKQLISLKSIAWAFGILPLCMAVGGYFLLTSKPKLMAWSWATGWILTGLVFFYLAMPRLDHESPVQKSMTQLKSDFDKREIVAYKQFNPAFVFNLGKVIPVFDSIDALQEHIAGRKCLVITRSKYLSEIEGVKDLQIVFQGKDLFEKNETSILIGGQD
ncbi:MAG: glycosyltransferase family 39 protein [Chryseolinea sp.]